MGHLRTDYTPSLRSRQQVLRGQKQMSSQLAPWLRKVIPESKNLRPEEKDVGRKNRENRPPPVTGNGVSPGSYTQKKCLSTLGAKTHQKQPSAQHMTMAKSSDWHKADPHGSPE